MKSREQRALEDARAKATAAGWGDVPRAMRLHDVVIAAEVALARSRNEAWAEVLNMGVEWDTGAPLQLVVSDSSTTILVCRASNRDPNWDGTSVRVVSTSDAEPEPLLVFTFRECTSIRFGFPNEDVLPGIAVAGVRGYKAHRIHDSGWVAELNRIESVHPTPHVITGTHFLLAFHDEIFEAVADRVAVVTIVSTLGEALQDASRVLIQPPA